MAKRNRLTFYYTKQQWLRIENAANKLGRKSALNYIINQLISLEEYMENCEDCECKSKELPSRQVFYLPKNSEPRLEKLSQQMGLPPSAIVSRFIINPLLVK